MYDVSCSIVLYRNNPEIVKKAVSSLKSQELKTQIIIFDNSPTDSLKSIFDNEIIYIHEPNNVGFGKGHNYCIKIALSNSKYCLILNPDVYFEKGVLARLIYEYENNPSLGLIAPKVLYPDNRIQYSCRMLPSPIELIVRRLPIISTIFSSWIDKKNLVFTGYNKMFSPSFVLGCFMFLPSQVFEKIGFFDDHMFMYMEDVDLTRRIKMHFNVVFLPHVEIFHSYERQSTKNLRLLMIHLKSAIYYFNKWGWFFDSQKEYMNRIENILIYD